MLCTQNTILPPTEQKDLWAILTQLPPIPPAPNSSGFAGRDMEIREIEERLLHDNVVYLSGLGGMGKTELALSFGRMYKRGMVYFVPFQESFFNTIAEGIGTYIDRFTVKSQDESYQLTMDRLAQCSDKDILIIDNVDADSGTLEDLINNDTYRKLSAMKLRLILTTRFDVPRAVRIHPMQYSSLYSIFDQHGVSLSQAQMDELISAVNGHPLTVELMARTLNRMGQKSITPEMLLEVIQGNTLSSTKYGKIVTDYSQSEEQEQIYQHLRILFNTAYIPEDGKVVLRYATMLPAGGMNSKYFASALTDEQLDALYDLLHDGWLNAVDDLLTIHPVVRLVCREELKPSNENCNTFLNALWKQFDTKEYDRVKFAEMAEIFTIAADTLEDPEAVWLNRSGLLWLDLAQFQKAIELYERHIPVLEQRNPFQPALATACNNLGSAYGELGDYQKELEYQQKALKILSKKLPSDHPDLANSYNHVGNTCGKLGDHQKALEYQQKALKILSKKLPSDHPDLATTYINIGGTYGNLGDHKRALEYMLRALEIREKVLHPEHPDLADAYNRIGYIYGDLGDHRKALEYTLKALTIREWVLPPNHPDLASSYNNIASTYRALGDHSTAIAYYLKALTIREKIFPHGHPVLASAYSNVGIAYDDLGDHNKALDYLLKALNIQEQVLPSDHPDLAVSCNNVAWTYRAIGQFQDSAKYMRQAADLISRSSLPKNHPNRVNYRNWANQFEKDAKMQETILAQVQSSNVPPYPFLKK